jgi:integrase
LPDDDGNQVYPRKWNHEFIDMPIVEQSEQNRPSFSPEIMTGLATYRHPREQMLFVLAGAAGLRIGEALGIEIDKHLSDDCSTITVEQKARHGRVERRVKSVNAKREVDLHPAIAKLLKDFIAARTAGFLFKNEEREASNPNQCPSSPPASGVEGTGVREWAHARP